MYWHIIYNIMWHDTHMIIHDTCTPTQTWEPPPHRLWCRCLTRVLQIGCRATLEPAANHRAESLDKRCDTILEVGTGYRFAWTFELATSSCRHPCPACSCWSDPPRRCPSCHGGRGTTGYLWTRYRRKGHSCCCPKCRRLKGCRILVDACSSVHSTGLCCHGRRANHKGSPNSILSRKPLCLRMGGGLEGGTDVCIVTSMQASPRLIGFFGIYCIQGQNWLRHFIILSSTTNFCVIPHALRHLFRITSSSQLILFHPPLAPRGAKDNIDAISAYLFFVMQDRILSSPKPSSLLQ